MAENRIRCPYCRKIFLWKKPAINNPDSLTINLSCPYCKEQLVLKKEMIMK